MESFQELELPEFLRQSLRQMNFVKPTPVQAQAIPVALAGKDVIASAQTGTGKTAAFGLPLLAYLEKNGDKTALVLTPTRELALQVLDVLRKLTGAHNLGGSVLLIGGANMNAQFAALARKPRLVIGTPGRVIDHLNRNSLSLAAAGFLVLDEADRMLDMGFAPQLEEIRKRLTAPRQTLLFSATLPPDIQAMGSKYLKDPVRITVGPPTQPVPKVAQKVLYTTEPKKPEELLGELKERRGSALIFARTQHRVDRIMNRLKENGVKATRIHGGRSQSQRRQAIDQFREGKFDVLVATDIAARGLDIHHIAHVINYDLPRNPEDYIHRVGRTARAGAEGESLCFLTPEDNDLWRRILRLMGADAPSIPVKASRFGFTAPKPEPGPKPAAQAPKHPHSHHRHPHPHQGHPPQHPTQRRPEDRGERDFQPRHSQPRPERRPGGGHGQHRDHRQGRDPRRFQQGGEGRHKGQDRFIFHGKDYRQPDQNEKGDWQPRKEENFLQRLGKKLMGGGQHRRDHREGFRNRQDFRGDPRRQEHRHGDHRGNRFEHGYDGASGAPHRRPHGDRRFDGHRNNFDRRFEGNGFEGAPHHRPQRDPRQAEHRPHRHPHSNKNQNFRPKQGFRPQGHPEGH